MGDFSIFLIASIAVYIIAVDGKNNLSGLGKDPKMRLTGQNIMSDGGTYHSMGKQFSKFSELPLPLDEKTNDNLRRVLPSICEDSVRGLEKGKKALHPAEIRQAEKQKRDQLKMEIKSKMDMGMYEEGKILKRKLLESVSTPSVPSPIDGSFHFPRPGEKEPIPDLNIPLPPLETSAFAIQSAKPTKRPYVRRNVRRGGNSKQSRFKNKGNNGTLSGQ